MRILGAVLAGGRSSRFGSDKAAALLDGRTLLAWAVAALGDHAGETVLCGRAGGLPDRPAGGLGPLAGLNAALHAARDRGFDAVLSMPCDTPRLIGAPLRRLCETAAPAYLDGTPVIGLWPAALSAALDSHLHGGERSMRSWIARTGAVAVPVDGAIANINTQDDLARLRAGVEAIR